MYYLSTRNKELRLTAAQAIAQGLAPDGGLLTPAEFPTLSVSDLEMLRGMDYPHRAAWVMKQFLDDFDLEELELYAKRAYGRFDCPEAAPVKQVDGDTWCLELWHGPTCAFKDMALQMLPQLLSASLVKNKEEKQVCILVATSGDTGKAALEGFKDVDRTRILVFYPRDGVSDIQKLQMATQEGANVGVCAVEGNFDDAQTGVKRIFSDETLRVELAGRGWFLSSANSINWGRVLPQVVYYISAYCDLLNAGALNMGDKVNFCVPTGNFGDILAGYYAKKMGLPVGKLICASNANNVLTDFLRTGIYDRNRRFYTTTSPSMDILISSNLERMLFELSGGNDEEVRGYMSELSKTGKYTVSESIKAGLGELFAAGYCDDALTSRTIGKMWKESRYLIDPHTAVAFQVLGDYRAETGDGIPTVVLSTASPFKFCSAVLPAIGVEELKSGTEIITQLSEVTGVAAPRPLAELAGKEIRFTACASKEKMEERVTEFLR